MIKHSDIYSFMENLAPLALAETWDKVGQAIGDEGAITTKIVVCLDVTDQTIALAEREGANLIICHHPLFFNPYTSLIAGNVEEKLILDLVRKDIAVYTAHTNLDAAAGGVADSFLHQTLADLVYSKPVRVLVPADSTLEGEQPVGHGRYCDLAYPLEFASFYKIISEKLACPFCRIQSAQPRPVKRICFCPGAFAEEWIDALVEARIDSLVVGEIKHYVGLALAARDINLFAVGHDISERTVLEPLAQRLRAQFPELDVLVDLGIDYFSILEFNR